MDEEKDPCKNYKGDNDESDNEHDGNDDTSEYKEQRLSRWKEHTDETYNSVTAKRKYHREEEEEEDEKEEPIMTRKKKNKRMVKKTYIEDGDNDDEESEAVTTGSKNSKTQNEVRVQRKIQNKPSKLASAKVAKSKATKKV